MGLSAPVSGVRHSPRLALLLGRPRLFWRHRGQRTIRRGRPGARGALRLRRIVRRRHPRHRRGYAVHGAVHGRRRRIRARSAVADRAGRLRSARAGAGPALSRPDFRARVEPPPAEARPLDGAAAAASRVSALCIGRVAGVGGEPAGRTARCRRGARRTRAHRLRGVAPPGARRRPHPLAAYGHLDRRGTAPAVDRGGDRRAGPARRRHAGTRARGRPRRPARLGAVQPRASRRATGVWQAGLRELHRSLVRHLSGQRERRAQVAGRRRRLQEEGRGGAQSRLD